MNIKKIIFYLFLFSILLPGTDGTIRGRVLNMKGEPLPGAQIFIQELGIGTIADIEGNYFLLNVNVGQYDVTVAMIGYATQEITGVDVIMDQTIWLNFSMNCSESTKPIILDCLNSFPVLSKNIITGGPKIL